MKRILLKIYHFLQRLVRETKKFPKNVKEFNFRIAHYIFLDGLIPPGKTEKYINTIFEYVNVFEQPVVERYKNEQYLPQDTLIHEFDKVPVWCCWWQGAEQMPEIVAMCHTRLKQIIPNNAELHVITEKNYRDYVTLPEHVLKKFKEGKITVTTLSDILRMCLLSDYGGFWIDATVFISSDFPEEFISHDYFAQCMNDTVKWNREACKGRWCGFLMSGSKNNILFRFVRDAFFYWWKKHDDIIDYVLIDYLTLVGYENIKPIHDMIDKLPGNNEDVFEMYKVLHYPYSEDLYKDLTRTTHLHKLTYKMDLYKKTKDGEETLYQHMLNTVNSAN